MLRPGHGLILCSATLLILGVIMVNSAGQTVGSDPAFSSTSTSLPSILTSRTAIYAVAAGIVLVLASLVPLGFLRQRTGWQAPTTWLALIIICLLLAVHVPGLSRTMNGSSRWLRLGSMSFQPSELAKWGMLIILAWHCARQGQAGMQRFTTGLLPPGWLLLIVCALIAIEDLGTAVLIGLVGMCMLMAGGVKVRQAALVIPLGIVGFLAALWQSPYRVNRLLAYLNPYDDPQGIGYHIVQSLASISGGGLAGHGLGNGVRKFGYLPEDTTDFIFAVICEELGIFGAALVVFLYAGMLLCCLLIIRHADSVFERLLGLGVSVTIGLQALINLLVVTGMAPTKGIALPLISHGGTGWLLTACSIGLLVGIDRRTAARRAVSITDRANPAVMSISPHVASA
ncbi:MAG: FtsW/RodA/SpoVE family cell cycle protein [Phycisphaerales bacterium]